MKTFAQVLFDKLHWKFEAEECPEFAPDIVIIDITGVTPEPQEGWSWDGKKFTPPPAPSKDATVATITGAVQAALDSGAGAWGYSSIVSAASYATSTNAQFSADAKALIKWRDDVWNWAYPKFADVVPGETPEQFMVDMPKQPAQPKP